MSSLPRVCIGAQGLSMREELLLMAMLRISKADHPRLQWEYVSDQPCDVLIGADPRIADLGSQTRPLPVVVMRPGDVERDGLALHLPLRIDAVAALLGQLERRLLKPAAVVQVVPRAIPVAAGVARPAFTHTHAASSVTSVPAAECFTERLHRQLQEHPEILELAVPGQAPIVVIECWRKQYFLPAEGPKVLSGDSWTTLLGQLGEDCEIRAAPATRIAHLACPAPRRTLDRLLWRLGVTTSQLLRWLPAHAQFQLRRWPDFGALGTQAKFIKLAAMLVRQASTVETLVRDGRMQRTEVIAFLNGCELCGLLKVTAPSAEVRSVPTSVSQPVVPAAAGMRGLLGRIRSALHLG